MSSDISDINAHVGIILCNLFSLLGASFSTATASKFIDLSLKNFIPIIFSGVLAIYGFVVTLICISKLDTEDPNNILSAGLISGFSNLFSGVSMKYICDRTEENNIGLMLALVFSESFGLYGLISALIILN